MSTFDVPIFTLQNIIDKNQRCHSVLSKEILKWLEISWKCTFACTFAQEHLSKIAWSQERSWRLASLKNTLGMKASINCPNKPYRWTAEISIEEAWWGQLKIPIVKSATCSMCCHWGLVIVNTAEGTNPVENGNHKVRRILPYRKEIKGNILFRISFYIYGYCMSMKSLTLGHQSCNDLFTHFIIEINRREQMFQGKPGEIGHGLWQLWDNPFGTSCLQIIIKSEIKNLLHLHMTNNEV